VIKTSFNYEKTTRHSLFRSLSLVLSTRQDDVILDLNVPVFISNRWGEN
jgi:hypothetical protein